MTKIAALRAALAQAWADSKLARAEKEEISRAINRRIEQIRLEGQKPKRRPRLGEVLASAAILTAMAGWAVVGPVWKRITDRKPTERNPIAAFLLWTIAGGFLLGAVLIWTGAAQALLWGLS